MSSPCHTNLCTTCQIHIFSVDLTYSYLIYSAPSLTTLKYILLTLLSGNWLLVILTITLALIDRDDLCQWSSRNP